MIHHVLSYCRPMAFRGGVSPLLTQHLLQLCLSCIHQVSSSHLSVTCLCPSILWGYGMICGKPLRGSSRWCFLFLWCVVSIGMSCYWQWYNLARGIRRRVILHKLNQRMPYASNQVRWKCLWIPRCVHLVLVVGFSCILVLTMLEILIGSVWVSCAIMMDLFISMLTHFFCRLQCHICRHMTIVSLLVRQTLGCSLWYPWWWQIGGT